MINASDARRLIVSNIHYTPYVLDRINDHVISACNNGNNRVNLSVELPEYFSVTNTGEYVAPDTSHCQQAFDSLRVLGYTINIISRHVSSNTVDGKQVAARQHHIIISW